MKAYLIAIGDELLSGKTLDTNSNYIALELDKIGIYVSKISIISDKIDVIEKELNQAFNSDADFIFTTGGLGPTKDDKTKQIITDFLSDNLVLHEPTLQYIKEIYSQRKRVLNELTYNQAMVPSKSEVIINKYGTAPILWTKKESKILINLPGVPYETRAMVSEFIIPKIKKEFQLGYIIRKSITVLDIPESELAITLEDWETHLPDFISLAYLPAGARVELRLSSIGDDKEKIEHSIQQEIEKLYKILGKNIIPSYSSKLEEIIGEFLNKEKLNLSVAESITGGTISERITSVSGSSSYYKGGITSYSVETKINILEVNEDIIKQNTVVSEKVAEQMAEQTAKLFNTDIAISTTGVAGPDSDEFNNLVGLAYIGLYFKGNTYSEKYFYPNLTRDEMITRISNKALEMLYFKLIDKKLITK